MSVSKGKVDAQKAKDDYDPPVLTKAQHGKFLDSEACVGVQNQFLTLEEAAHVQGPVDRAWRWRYVLPQGLLI